MSATYSPATIRRCRTILARAERERQAVRNVSKPAPKAAKPKVDWTLLPATDGQVKRINRAEKALGYRVSSRATIGTGGEARALWQSLRDELNQRGIVLAR